MSHALFEVGFAGGAAGRAWQRIAGAIETDHPWTSFRPDHYDAALLARGRLGWTENAFNEYCTGAAMGQLVQVLCEASAPLDLIGLAGSFVVDEMLHVELCSRVAMLLGGGASITYDPGDLHLEFDSDLTPLQQANELVVRVCCVGEEFSLPMLAGSMRAATHPLVRSVLERIVRDEAAHGLLGWQYLDWASPSFDLGERARLAAAADDTAQHIEALFGRLLSKSADEARDPPPGFHDMGWMAPDAYTTLARDTMRVQVRERLRSYGIG